MDKDLKKALGFVAFLFAVSYVSAGLNVLLGSAGFSPSAVASASPLLALAVGVLLVFFIFDRRVYG